MMVIKERLDNFASMEHIDQLKNKLLPKVQEFSNKVDEYQTDNNNMKAIIQQFDVNLSLKCNKE